MNNQMKNDWINFDGKIPEDWGETEIAWGYIEEPSSSIKGFLDYAPIYFSDNDWHISGGSKETLHFKNGVTKEAKLIAYFRIPEYNKTHEVDYTESLSKDYER